jgi:hypothetical protein
MARKKRQRPGLSYFGRKVETQQIRFDKDVFFEKNKSVGVGGALTTTSFDVNGKAITEFQGRKINNIADTNDAIAIAKIIQAGILLITPTADRTRALPSFTGGSSWNEYLLEDFSAFDFVVLNQSSGFSLTLVVNGLDLQNHGSLVIRPNSSGIFRVLRLDSSEARIIRLGNDDSSLATLTSIVLDGNTITGIDDSSEFTDDDAHIMTSAAINDRFAQINADTTGTATNATKQIVVTHHHFFMNSSSTTTDFFFPYNNLNEASSTSQYYTRTIAPYDGRIIKVLIRPSAAIGTACKLQFHKITDTTLNFGTAVEEVTNVNLNTAETSVSTAFSSATFSAGDVVNVSLIKSSSSTANIQAVIVWEYTT